MDWILGLISTATSVLSAVVGMAGGVTLLSLMTFFLSWEVIVPVHGMVQLTSNSSRAFFLKSHVRKDIFWAYVAGTPIGVLLSLYLLKEILDRNVPLLLLVCLIFYVLFKPKKLPPLKIPPMAYAGVGALAGLFALLIGATGPLIAPFFIRDDLSKEEIVATKASVQLVTHFIKIPSFVYLGFAYGDHIFLILIMSAGAVVGTYLGVQILGKVSQNLFLWLYKTALLVAALRISWKLFEAWS